MVLDTLDGVDKAVIKSWYEGMYDYYNEEASGAGFSRIYLTPEMFGRIRKIHISNDFEKQI